VALIVLELVGLFWATRPPRRQVGQVTIAEQPLVMRLSGTVRLWRGGAPAPLLVTDAATLGTGDRVQKGA